MLTCSCWLGLSGLTMSIRRMLFERVREGERPGDVTAFHGFNRTTTMYKWISAAPRILLGRGGLTDDN